MADDATTGGELDTGSEPPQAVHDDIVKRLLDYQRRLREGDDAAEVVVMPEVDEPEAAAVDLAAGDRAAVVDDVPIAASTTDEAISGERELASDGSTSSDPSTAPAGTTRSLGRSDDDPTPALTRLEEAIAAAEAVTREGGTSDAASIEEDVTSDEAIAHGTPDPATSLASSSAETDARIERLERALGDLSTRLSDLRASFADMAVAADERLADIEDLLRDARRP
jgi:hypothetical protein